MAGTSKADDVDDLVAPFRLSSINDEADINAKTDDGNDDVVHEALNDGIQDGSNNGIDIKIVLFNFPVNFKSNFTCSSSFFFTFLLVLFH